MLHTNVYKCLLWGKAERVGCSAQRREDSGENHSVPKGVQEEWKGLFPKAIVIGQEGLGLSWKRAGLEQILGRNSWVWDWWETGTDCPEKWWMPNPWEHSRPGWTGLWETWSSWECPCPWQAIWTWWPSNSSCFQLKAFYDSIWL